MAVGGRVCVSDGGTGVAGREVGESVGNPAGLKVGGSVGVGVNVLVGNARTIRVWAEVVVGAGLEGVDCPPNSPSTLSKNNQRELGRCFAIVDCSSTRAISGCAENYHERLNSTRQA